MTIQRRAVLAATLVAAAIATPTMAFAQKKITLGFAQVGFARVVTDKASFAYLADVYVLEEHRRRGLSKRLVEAIQAHPDLQGLRRFMLATLDAHSLYAQFGFKPVAAPERLMEIRTPPAWLKDSPTS